MVRLTLYRALTCIVLIFGIFSIANAQAPVPIKPAIIRDLSGYWVHGGGGNSPDRFFDAFGHIDPKNGVTTFPATHRGDTTFALPFRMDGIYYPKGALGRGKMMYNGDRGLRLLFDFTGAADVLDTTRRVKLTDIYAYNKVYENGDTMYVYNFDEVLRKPVSERWKYIARPDSLLQPIAKVSTESNIGYGKWVNKAVNDSVRYLLIRFVEKDRGFYKTTANFAELVFYGNYQYNPAAVVKRDGVYTGPLPKKNTLKQTYGKFVGTNEGTGFDTSTLKYDNLVRLYGATDYWDTTRSATNTATAPYTFDYFLDVNVKYYKHFKSRGAIFWWSIKGPSKYAESTVPGGSGGMMPNMNRWGLEPEDPNSYWRSGDFFYNYAAKYGSVAVPAGNTKWQGDAGFPNGQNALNYVENGNEEQFNGMTMLAYALKSFVDYDGWEGRVGTPGRTGLINADPTFKLIQAGTVFPDSNYIDCLHFFSKVLRTDGKFVWSVINNHHYSRTYNNKVEYSPTYEQQVMETGESAEKDLLLDKMTAYTKAYYNILGGDTSVKVYLTEIGYDNFSTPAATQEQLYIPWTTSGTPLIPGLDSLRSKAIIMSRMEMILNFTPLSGYNEFFFHNVADNSPMLFATCGRVTGGQMAPIRFPWFWYRAGMYNHLKDYYPDKIISKDGDDLWVTKWTHINYPDSVCFAVWKGSYNNSTLPNQSISVGSVVANNVKKVELSFTQPDGTSSAISAGGGYINVNAEERPIFYFFKQDTVMIANQPPTANAGIDMVITLPTDSIQLTGYGSDPEGKIAAYAWTLVSGPSQYTIVSPSNDTTMLRNLVEGVYNFRLQVTDSAGAFAHDFVTIIVNNSVPNQLPLANAGTDISIALPINQTNLSGSAIDADGTIVSYAWSWVSGPTQYAIENVNAAVTGLENLSQGVYVFQLQVIDNKGGMATDMVQVTVNPAAPPPNQAPIANAGADVSLPAPALMALDATGSFDPDGSIDRYDWVKISGPGGLTIVNATAPRPILSGLQPGTYVFELTVTDNRNSVSRDQVTVVVNTPVNKPPVAKAGTDTTINYPSLTSILNGNQSYDPDGNIRSYSWRKLKGPQSGTILSPKNPETDIQQLSIGDYEFELTVTDDNNAVSSDTVKVSLITQLRYTGSIRVFPNPVVTEDITIDALNDFMGKVRVTFFDPAGKLIEETQFEKTAVNIKQKVKVSALSKGTYLMKVQFYGQDQPFVFTILKQ